MDNQQKIDTVVSELEKLYPNAVPALNFSNAFELLIAVILSAQCTDERVNKVTQDLFKKYPEPENYLSVSQEELEQEIRPTGFYRNKAKSLRACCEKLIQDYDGKLPKTIDEMSKLPGVGRKTAAMVLGNARHIQQGIAVDTHVKRVINRLEISLQKNPDKIEKELLNLVPKQKWTWTSNSLILFGRQICEAKKPNCSQCPFKHWCPFPDKTI